MQAWLDLGCCARLSHGGAVSGLRREGLMQWVMTPIAVGDGRWLGANGGSLEMIFGGQRYRG